MKITEIESQRAETQAKNEQQKKEMKNKLEAEY